MLRCFNYYSKQVTCTAVALPPTVIVGWPKITRIINKKRGHMPERHYWLFLCHIMCLLCWVVYSLHVFFINFKVFWQYSDKIKTRRPIFRRPVSRCYYVPTKLLLYEPLRAKWLLCALPDLPFKNSACVWYGSKHRRLIFLYTILNLVSGVFYEVKKKNIFWW